MSHGNCSRNHAIKADVHRVRVGKRFWLFTFSEQWGPMLTDEWAEPIDNTPLADEAHPFWGQFEAWLNTRALPLPAAGSVGPAAAESRDSPGSAAAGLQKDA